MHFNVQWLSLTVCYLRVYNVELCDCDSTVGVDVTHSGSLESESMPKGLVTWREAVFKSQTAAQLSMGLHMLEASIAWDKSIMKAVSYTTVSL